VDGLAATWRAEAGAPRRDSAAARLIERLPERPALDVAEAARLTGVSRRATPLAIDRLFSGRVLRELTGKRRLRRWEAVGLFALLDALEFASPGAADAGSELMGQAPDRGLPCASGPRRTGKDRVAHSEWSMRKGCSSAARTLLP
jgi:hypothetical protein